MPAIALTEPPSSLPNSGSEPSKDPGQIFEEDFPRTLFEIRDLCSEGPKRFLSHIDISTILNDATRTVLRLLTPRGESYPNVRSITLIFRDFDGVAYTTGKDIDSEHKEIHFSTSYILSIAPERITDEITGVLVHEMVHVWQWNGEHACKMGLIEGIADWVRLHADLAPPHWKRRCEECEWDSGYDVTAYFLSWMKERFGQGTVVKMNQKLKGRYAEEEFWKEYGDGDNVKALWAKYTESLGADQQNLVPQDKLISAAVKGREESEDEMMSQTGLCKTLPDQECDISITRPMEYILTARLQSKQSRRDQCRRG